MSELKAPDLLADVRIVCVREDVLLGEALAAAFHGAGFTIEADPTADASADSVGAGVLLLSQAAIKSSVFRAAAQSVISAGKAVVLNVTGAPPPSAVAGSPVFDLSGWEGDPDDPRLDEVSNAVEGIVGATRGHAVQAEVIGPPPPPPEPVIAPVIAPPRASPPAAIANTRTLPPPAPKQKRERKQERKREPATEAVKIQKPKRKGGIIGMLLLLVVAGAAAAFVMTSRIDLAHLLPATPAPEAPAAPTITVAARTQDLLTSDTAPHTDMVSVPEPSRIVIAAADAPAQTRAATPATRAITPAVQTAARPAARRPRRPPPEERTPDPVTSWGRNQPATPPPPSRGPPL